MSDIQNIELDITSAKEQVELGKSLEILHKNRHFKKIFLDGYFKDEAVRLVHLKSNPGQQEPVDQTNIVKQIDAIGSTIHYLNSIYHLGKQAEAAIEDYELELEEARQED